ncbi:sensor histidine kinase [Streptomyces sp. NPDC056061]|uniref:sensor histidine kinase n=1 Tax=Streptomyces sp. NPDC056061 TaxID=3345700 RepID=UPI0035D5C709
MVSAVALIAVVAAVIGSVTTIAYRSYMYGKLDDQLHAVAVRAAKPPGGLPMPPGGLPHGGDPLAFVDARGLPVGAFGAVVSDGSVTASRVVVGSTAEPDPVAEGDGQPMTGAQTNALTDADIREGDEARNVDLPGLGVGRVEAVAGPRGTTILVGLPAAEVDNALTTLIVVEVCVTGAGLIAAGIAGTTMVGVALRPLRRVVTTASRVSELPLHSGEVALLERVPEAEADPRTEIGQVGAALNRLLGHVGSALEARQESETRVRQFVADASHELRTPLASIRGYAELTRRGGEETGPDTRHALRRIESEAERMTGMVEDLLLLARLDAGRPLSHEPTDLSPVVVDAVSDARAAGRREHHWRLELPDEPAIVHGDPTRLHQVLVNLLANARTHTPPGTTVTVRVRVGGCGAGAHRTSAEEAGDGVGAVGAVDPGTRSGGSASSGSVFSGSAPSGLAFSGSAPSGSMSGGTAVTLEVQDDGPGIPPRLLPHVFERFVRGDASRSRTAGSTGLGLAIVQAVVAAHGGRVEVMSVPGRTVFAVHLPTGATAPSDRSAFHDSERPSTLRGSDDLVAPSVPQDSQPVDRSSTSA